MLGATPIPHFKVKQTQYSYLQEIQPNNALQVHPKKPYLQPIKRIHQNWRRNLDSHVRAKHNQVFAKLGRPSFGQPREYQLEHLLQMRREQLDALRCLDDCLENVKPFTVERFRGHEPVEDLKHCLHAFGGDDRAFAEVDVGAEEAGKRWDVSLRLPNLKDEK